jgi:hypothetical protein
MSVTTSPTAFADPLAEDSVPPSWPADESQGSGKSKRADQDPLACDGAHQGRVTRDRATLLAPDVEGQLGADAIELVRASGLIAAIETVEIADDSHQGLVVDQDPPAGTPMLREGVLTLSVAQAPAEQLDIDAHINAGEHQPASATSAYGQHEDDTEQWFAELGPSAPAGQSPESVAASPPRRRRKHRPAPVPVTGVKSQPALQAQLSTDLDSGDTHRATLPFEVPPDPLPTASDSPTEELPNLSREPAACDPPAEEYPCPSPQPTGPGHLAYLIAAVLVRLPALPASGTRRRALIFAAAIVGLLLFTHARASHSHGQTLPSLATAPISRARVVPSRASVHPRNGFAAGGLPRPASSRPSAGRTPRPGSTAASRKSVTAVASAAHPVPTTTAPSSPPSEPPPGPFVYLGK